MRNRKIVGGIFVGLLVLLGCTQGLLQQQANQTNQGELVNAPAFEVDPLWPKPLPNHWLLGMTIGVWVDEQDHVWIIHRSSATLNANERGAELEPPTGECCRGAPPVLEFDPAGNLLRHWGGPGQGYEWPQSNHGIFVDYKGNVWIGGNGEKDAHILKFTKDGKFLMQVGRLGNNKGSNDLENFGRVAKIFVDPKTNEAFVADGYGNRRVAVLDADTGKMKRYWGAYGNRPQDGPLAPFNPDAPPSQQFRNPVHCSDVSNDGFVYVCDRQGNRLQVFTKDGKFVKEQWYARRSLSEGSVWDVAFSRDPEQRYLFMADGRNQKVRIILRETLEEITNFGDGGRQPGQFFGVHSIATDSKGNLYTTETYEGKRLQKFVYKGMRQVRRTQGVAWPSMLQVNPVRRDFLKRAWLLGAGLAVRPALAQPESERPKEGDVLVAIEGDSRVPLEPKDIPRDARPLLAWPMDPAGNVVRGGSRLNKVLLLRLDPATLVGGTRERAADGVVAYSAICPHAGCEVNVWAAEQKTLECSCHYSHYNPRDGAAVIDGPTPRALAALALKLADGKLVVAKPFSGRVGIVPT